MAIIKCYPFFATNSKKKTDKLSTRFFSSANSVQQVFNSVQLVPQPLVKKSTPYYCGTQLFFKGSFDAQVRINKIVNK